jgi:hypothetical protein
VCGGGVEVSANKAVVVWLAVAVACMPSVASWISHATPRDANSVRRLRSSIRYVRGRKVQCRVE